MKIINFRGKRAREDSSPNEADAKKRRRSIQNNEISSSLSSSKSVKAPHLQPQKRKAQGEILAISNKLMNLLFLFQKQMCAVIINKAYMLLLHIIITV